MEKNPSQQRSGRGLCNTGNTCFLNATIQCLGAIDEVNQLLPSTNESTTTQDKLLVCIRELQKSGTAYTPAPLIQRIPHLIRYREGDPADAHELLIALIKDHVGDVYPASSFSSVRLVSSWMTMISSCSRSNHRFRKKINCCCAIVHPLCGSMHVVRPSVLLILVLPRRSSQGAE